MIHKQCLLCGKKQKLETVYPARFNKQHLVGEIFSARRVPDKIHYRVVRCQKCGLIFSSPILPPQSIARLYNQSICGYGEQIPYVTETYWQLFKKFKRFMPTKPKVLEVGCGTGFFLEKLRQQKINDGWGVEPGQAIVDQAPLWLKQRIKVGIFRRNLFDNNMFDVVVCFHTLDHMVAPQIFAKEAYKILKPGGIIVVVVHDNQGLSVKLFGERSPIFDLEHIYLFNKTTLAELFKRHRFDIVEVGDLVNTYPMSYWLQMSGLADKVKGVGRKILEYLHLETRPLSFGGGNIFLVTRK